MKSKGLIWASLILGALVAVAVWDHKKTEHEEQTKAVEEKVLSVEESQIKSLTLKNEKGEVAVVRDTSAKTWKLVRPLEDSVDEDALKSVINAALEEKYEQVVAENEADLKIYGLDNPKSSLTVELTDGKKKEVLVGAEAPIPGKLYLKVQGDPRVLVASILFRTQSEKTVKDLRDKRIFRLDSSKATKISWKNHRKANSSQFDLEKTEKGWVLSTNKEISPDDQVTSFLNAVEAIKANDFDPEGSDFSKPDLELEFFDKEGKSLEKYVVSASKDNSAFIKGSKKDTVYKIFSSHVDQLAKTPTDFRDRQAPLKFKKEDVAQIVARNSLVEVQLEKQKDKWVSLKSLPKGKEVSQLQSQALIDRLEGLRVLSFLGEVKHPSLKNPKKSIALKDKEGKILLELAWGEKFNDKTEYYAKSNLSSEALGLDQVALDGMPFQTLITDVGGDAKAQQVPELPHDEH